MVDTFPVILTLQFHCMLSLISEFYSLFTKLNLRVYTTYRRMAR